MGQGGVRAVGGLLALLLLVVCSRAQDTSSSTYYVNQTSIDNDPAHCGRNWTTACSTLASGVQAACRNATTRSVWLWVAPGNYSLAETLTIPCSLHLRSTQGSAQTRMYLNGTLKNVAVQYSAGAGNASLEGFTIQDLTRTRSVRLLDVQGPLYEMRVRDLSVENSTWQALGQVDSVQHLRMEAIFLSSTRFAQTFLQVQGGDTVTLEGWQGTDVRMRSANLSMPLSFLSIAAHGSVSIQNITLTDFQWWGGGGSQVISVEQSPQLTLAHVVLDSLSSTYLLYGALPVTSAIELEDITISGSAFESHAMRLEAPSKDASLQLSLTGLALHNVSIGEDFISLGETFTTLQTQWGQLAWQEIEARTLLTLESTGLSHVEASFADWNITTATLSTVVSAMTGSWANISASDLLWADVHSSERGPALWTWHSSTPLSVMTMQRMTVQDSEVDLFNLSGVQLTLSNSRMEHMKADTLIELTDSQVLLRSMEFLNNNVGNSAIGAQNCTVSIQGLTMVNNTGDNTYSPGFVHLRRCQFAINGTHSDNNIFEASALLRFRTSVGSLTYSSFNESAGNLGGSVFQQEGQLSVSHCEFNVNLASSVGGALCVERGDMQVDHALFLWCSSPQGGAVAALQNSNLTLSDCVMYQNRANSAGGAVFAQGSTVSLSRLVVESGYSFGGGGAIYVMETSLQVSQAVFRTVKTTASGGAMYVDLSHVNVSNSMFISNTAGLWGGDISSSSSVLSVTNCSFDGSRAETTGGSLWMHRSQSLLSGCTFNNTASRTSGGAIEVNEGPCQISGSSFKKAASYVAGGALHLVNTSTTINSTEFEECRSFEGGALYGLGGQVTLSHTQFEDCQARQTGGALHLNGSMLELSSTQCTNCSAQTGGALSALRVTLEATDLSVTLCTAEAGGGLALENTTALLSQVRLSECHATVGGAMVLQGHTLLQAQGLNITHCRVSSLSGGEGGGIYMLATSVLNATGALLAHNEATSGGALFLQEEAEAILQASTLQSNRATLGGAVTLGYSAQLTLSQQSLVWGNEASREGGAISAHTHARISIQHSTLEGNRVTQAGLGGAISLRDDVVLQVSDTLFQNNSATGGGAVATADLQACQAVAHFDNTSMNYNTAVFGGGAFLASTVQVTWEDLQCRHNLADLDGGCLYALGSWVNLSHALVEGNVATRGGGYWVGDKATFHDEHSLLRHNMASQGGALFLEGGVTSLQEVFMLENRATSQGGGVSVTLPSATLQLSHSHLYGNQAPQGGGLMLSGTPNATTGTVEALPSSVDNCTMANNTAEHGGGMYVAHLSEGMPPFVNCSWLGNNASSFGGALFVQSASYWPAFMSEANFADNVAYYGGCNLACLELGPSGSEWVHNFCQGCQYGSPPSNYQGYQNLQQFASIPSSITTNDSCDASLPIDEASTHMHLFLEDGFHTPVVGHYLDDNIYTVLPTWPYGVTANATNQTLSASGVVTYALSLCGRDQQEFTLQFVATSPNQTSTTLTALCGMQLNGCSQVHHSVKPSAPCDKCVLDTLIILLIVVITLIVASVVGVLCCVFCIAAKRSLRRYRLRTMQVPDLENTTYTIDDLLADSSVTQLGWEEVEMGPVLGKGASGLVRQATWKRGANRQSIATKELFLMMDGSLVEQTTLEFCKEVKYMSVLHHPNVVSFIGVLLSPDHSSLFVVTELMERGSLHDILIKKGANIPLSLRFKVALDAAQGMEFIHSKNIIHRDLKPHNLLVNSTWDTKVADFGVSTLNPTMTRRMTCIGTPVYMAPEVLQLDAYSARADVYSFAVVLSELFTSSMAFSHDPYATMNSAQLAFHITEKAARPTLEGLHPTLENLIEECWSASPHARPSFTEIVARLKRLRNDLVGSTLEMPSVVGHDSALDEEPDQPSVHPGEASIQ